MVLNLQAADFFLIFGAIDDELLGGILKVEKPLINNVIFHAYDLFGLLDGDKFERFDVAQVRGGA